MILIIIMLIVMVVLMMGTIRLTMAKMLAMTIAIPAEVIIIRDSSRLIALNRGESL